MNDTITIVGVIGTDPEKTTPNGVPITKFRVASKDRKFDRTTGTWVDGETNWYTVSTYRRLADHCFASLRKRDRVILTGRLRVRNWEAGDKRGTSVDIDADAIGPELQFGTTTYTPVAAAAEGSSPATAPTDDSWALTEDPQDEESDSRSPALVGAETPF